MALTFSKTLAPVFPAKFSEKLSENKKSIVSQS